MVSILVFFLAAWLASATAALGATQVDPVAVAQQFFEATNRGDIPAMLALVTDDHVHEGGPCFAQPCIGKAAFQQALERVGPDGFPTIRTLSIEASGTTVVARNEVRPPFLPEPLRAQGVERIIEIETFELRGDKIASLRSVPDASDPQTAAALAFFSQAQPGAAPARAGESTLPVYAALAAGAGLLGLGLALRRARRSL